MFKNPPDFINQKRKLQMNRQTIVKRIYLVINLLIRISLLIAIIQAIQKTNIIVLFFSTLVFLITFIPLFFKRKYNLRIPTEIEIIIVLFLYASLFLGEVHNYYLKFWWWDILLHTGSAIIFGFVGFTILYFMYSQHKVDAKPINLAIFSFSFAIAIGAVWEIFEFSMDQLFGFNMQKSGLVDTMWDLIVDTLGAIFASSIGYFYLKTKKTLIFNGIINQIKIKREDRRKRRKEKKRIKRLRKKL